VGPNRRTSATANHEHVYVNVDVDVVVHVLVDVVVIGFFLTIAATHSRLFGPGPLGLSLSFFAALRAPPESEWGIISFISGV